MGRFPIQHSRAQAGVGKKFMTEFTELWGNNHSFGENNYVLPLEIDRSFENRQLILQIHPSISKVQFVFFSTLRPRNKNSFRFERF
jgi:hypothetical protein